MDEIFKSLGKIFYKYISEDYLEVFRIIGFAGNDTVKVKVIEGGDVNSTLTMKYKTICEEYTFLLPDGVIVFSEVNVGTRNTDNGLRLNVSDIIVAQYRSDDISSGNMEPWAVCRQNITDLFSQMMVENPEDALVGMSTTKASLPAGVEYEIMMACESMNNSIMVNMYLIDTLDDILGLIKTQPFDKVLEANTIDHVRSVENKLNRKLKLKPGTKSVDGYCLTLRQLLTENNFWSDVEQGFNILTINTPIELTETMESLSEDMKYKLSHIIRKAIANTIVIKYDLDIDLSEFKNNPYVLVRDSNKDLYVVGYTTLGDYIEPDMENEAIKKEMEEIISMIPVDKSKYFM